MKYTSSGLVTTPHSTPAEIRAARREEEKIRKENKRIGDESIDAFLRRMDDREACAAARAAKTTPRAIASQSLTHHGAVVEKEKRQASSGDDDDPDPEPDRLPRQTYYSYTSTAQLLNCSVQTLRNKVSLGSIPRPIKTKIGPRFTADQIQSILIPPPRSSLSPHLPKGRRGRPRIAAQRGGAA